MRVFPWHFAKKRSLFTRHDGFIIFRRDYAFIFVFHHFNVMASMRRKPSNGVLLAMTCISRVVIVRNLVRCVHRLLSCFSESNYVHPPTIRFAETVPFDHDEMGVELQHGRVFRPHAGQNTLDFTRFHASLDFVLVFEVQRDQSRSVER